MITLRPVGRIRRLGASLGTDVLIGSSPTTTDVIAATFAKYSTAAKVAAPYVERIYPPPPMVVAPAAEEAPIPVQEVASRTVDGQSSSTIVDTYPEPSVPTPASDSGTIEGGTIDDYAQAAATEMGAGPTFWQQHKTKILIGAAVLGAYLILK